MVSVRLLAVSVILVLAVFSSALGVAASGSAIRIKRVSIESNSETVVFVTIESAKSLRNARVAALVPELGIMESLNVGLSKNKEKTVQLVIPTPLMFDPYVTVLVSGEGNRAVRHVPVLGNAISWALSP